MNRLFLLSLCLLVASCARNNDPVAQHAGRWLLVNYWAQWCKPCREEIPHLNAFATQHQATTSVAGVNFDGLSGEALQKQASALGITFELMEVDPAQLGHWPKPEVLPTTQLIDPQGKLVRTLTGPQTLESLVQALKDAQANK
jgi:thiol-disulfide isomerase/thioredoxin